MNTIELQSIVFIFGATLCFLLPLQIAIPLNQRLLDMVVMSGRRYP